MHQAAADLGRPELRSMLVDPSRPIPLYEAWRLLPAIAGEPGSHPQPFDPEAPPWPQFAELLALRASWAYPGPASQRRAFYRSDERDGNYEPLEPPRDSAALRRECITGRLAWPRTGLPRDPYALRPRHVDTARGVLDAPFSRSTAAWAARSPKASGIAESPSGSCMRRRMRRDVTEAPKGSSRVAIRLNALDGADGHADLDRQFVSHPR